MFGCFRKKIPLPRKKQVDPIILLLITCALAYPSVDLYLMLANHLIHKCLLRSIIALWQKANTVVLHSNRIVTIKSFKNYRNDFALFHLQNHNSAHFFSYIYLIIRHDTACSFSPRTTFQRAQRRRLCKLIATS